MRSLERLEGVGSGRPTVLVTGWFSFDWAEVTAGDLLAKDTVVGWLRDSAVSPLVAMSQAFRLPTDVALDDVNPARIDALVFVCGPAGGDAVERLFARFSHCRRIAVGVSVVDGTAKLQPVTLFPRDSSTEARPDLSVWAPASAKPVVGVIRAHAQPEYGASQGHDAASAAIDRLLTRSDVAPVALDTRLDTQAQELCSSPSQLLSALARLDAVITTRLHGLVLSLRVGVPAVAIDPIAGGAKLARQAQALGWPAVQVTDTVDDERLAAQLKWCLTDEASRCARECLRRAQAAEPELRRALVDVLADRRMAGAPHR